MSNAVIPKENQTAWQRWELGSWATRPGSAAAGTQAKSAAKLPTAEDIERIHRDAHKQGYDAGYEEGTGGARMEALRLHTLVEQLDGALASSTSRSPRNCSAWPSRWRARWCARRSPRGPSDPRSRARSADAAAAPACRHLSAPGGRLAGALLSRRPAGPSRPSHFRGARHARGGVRMDAGGSHLDASVETRWRRVIEGMGAASTGSSRTHRESAPR
jgi:flagellar assembly protein FliH